MYENYYHHLRLAEERTREGLRKAALAQHARAANAEATRQRRTFKGFLASLLSRLDRGSATVPERVPALSEADQRLVQLRSQ
jgi:hypothetical protein